MLQASKNMNAPSWLSTARDEETIMRHRQMPFPAGVAALALLALAMVWLLAGGTAQAAANSVRIEPAQATTAESVQLIAEPPTVVPSQDPNEAPAGGLAYWTIRVHYDPAIVQVAQGQDQNGDPIPLCTPMASPAGADAAVSCDLSDDDQAGTADDTVVSVGAVLFAAQRVGLTTQSTLATITFVGVGAAGACSDLTVEVSIFDDLRNDDNPTPSNPTVSNGEICVQGGGQAWGDVDCGGGVSIGDAQKLARALIGLPLTQKQPCALIKGGVLANGISELWGDVDCSGAVTIGDAQKVARSLINLPISQTPPCFGVQEQVTIVIAQG